MKTVASVFCAACGVLYGGVVVADSLVLPETVAADFGPGGRVDGWMSRSGFVGLMASVGGGVPVLLTTLVGAVRHVSIRLANHPRGGVWSQPRRLRRACDMLTVSTLWYCGGFLLTQAGLFHLLTSANLRHPPALNAKLMVALTAALGILTAGWALWLLTWFRKAATSPS